MKLLVTFGLCAALLGLAHPAAATVISPCDGTTDLAPQINTALAGFGSTGGVLEFSPGKCRINSAITYAYPATTENFAVSIKGAGSDVTALYFPNGVGVTLNMKLASQAFHVSDLTFSTGAAGVGAALSVTNAVQKGIFGQNDVRKVTFRGDGSLANYRTYGVIETGVSNINFDGDLFYGLAGAGAGTGIRIQGDAGGADKDSLVFNISNSGFYELATGLSLGDYWQGVQIVNSNFTNTQHGVVQQAGAVGILAELSISNSQFAGTSDLIDLNSDVDQVALSNNLFYVAPSSVGVYCRKCAGLSAVGNNFTYNDAPRSGQNGIVIENSATGSISTIVGNTFFGLTTGAWLQSTSSGVNMASNAFSGVSNQVVNSAPVGANTVAQLTN